MNSSSSRTKSSLRTLRFPNQSQSSTSPFASSTAQFSPRAAAAAYFSRSTARTRSSSYVRFPASPRRPISVKKPNAKSSAVSNKTRTCMCSPTTHPGSFRCAKHKKNNNAKNSSAEKSGGGSLSRGLSFRRSAMTNSLVRICGVEGELVKRAMTVLIRPSSHHQRRRVGFQPKPSRLKVMSIA